MKKILVLIAFFALAAVPFVRAEETISDLESAKELVDLQASRTGSKVDDLVRRVADLERDRKFQDDRIRNLERTVDDLKRRR